MIDDLTVWRAAKLLIDEHGEDAPTRAAMKADALLDEGDLDGSAVWRQILAAIEKLLREEPGVNEWVH